MLPLPQLDDITFNQMVESARKMISQKIPQWTDENYHDPGITFIELFAWLTEMQQFYLSQITVKNELKFLKLLGYKMRQVVSAKADITFTSVSKPAVLPKGSMLSSGDIPFETEKAILLLPVQLDKIIVATEKGEQDCTPSNNSNGVTYYAFGHEAKNGSKLYLGFDKELPVGEEICLTVNLYEDYPVKRGKSEAGEEFIPSARVLWKYYGQANEQDDDWLNIVDIQDETTHMSCSGRITIKLSTPMKPMRISLADDRDRYWICCTVLEEGYEIPPKITEILLNTMGVVQQKTLSEFTQFSGSGLAGQELWVGGYLPFYGHIEIQIRDNDGYWRYWKKTEDLSLSECNDSHYMLEKDEEKKEVIIKFGDGIHGKIPLAGENNIRLISFSHSFMENCMPGKSNGLPNQVISIYDYPLPQPIISHSFKIQVGRMLNGEYAWEDWERVDDFDASKPSDRHYILNPETGEILFGNNENGIIPEALKDKNICIISCQTGGGEVGNVKEKEINRASEDIKALGVVLNHYPAFGGMEKETLNEAKVNVRKELKKQYRAVTSEDYEEIARATPELRVARVKAIPLYEKTLKDYPKNKVPAQVTVVVVPYSEAERPTPSEGFLKTVQHHVDKHRLITTQVHVIAPEYIKITVYGTVVVSPHIKFDPQKIVRELRRLIDPLDDYDSSKGWAFGETVSKVFIYEAISQIDGVEYIKELWLDAEGTGFTREASGDIHIPPHSLVYSGNHKIEIMSQTDM